jgi:hypothetical protein
LTSSVNRRDRFASAAIFVKHRFFFPLALIGIHWSCVYRCVLSGRQARRPALLFGLLTLRCHFNFVGVHPGSCHRLYDHASPGDGSHPGLSRVFDDSGRHPSYYLANARCAPDLSRGYSVHLRLSVAMVPGLSARCPQRSRRCSALPCHWRQFY